MTELEEVLLGTMGVDRGVRRVGKTVRRPRHAQSDYVARLLRHLEEQGFSGAPRHLGVDEEGRDVLSYVEGAIWDPDPPLELPLAALVSAGRLVRRFHDLTAGTALAGQAEVASHPDLGPHNIVFQDLEAVAIIDWDEDVRPGTRLEDLGHLAWASVEVGAHGGPLPHQALRLSALVAAYAPDGLLSPEEALDEIEGRMRRARDRHAEQGHERAREIFQGYLDWHLRWGPELRAELAVLSAG